VVRVIENSPAATAGFRVGDVLLGWGGTQVDDPAALETLIERAAPGTQVMARVQRDDTVFEVPVRLRSAAAEAAGEARALYLRDPARSAAGWVTGRGGAVLAASAEGGPFPGAGVPVGSVVLEVDGREVLSARALIRSLQALAPGAEVLVRFQRIDGSSGEVEIELLDEDSVVTGAQVPILFNYSRDLERDSTEFVLIDLYLISLFRYTRNGDEREYKLLRWFQFSTGTGELSE
jgi:S1-C subfamily serine protease